jgi:hypothetical protein
MVIGLVEELPLNVGIVAGSESESIILFAARQIALQFYIVCFVNALIAHGK